MRPRSAMAAAVVGLCFVACRSPGPRPEGPEAGSAPLAPEVVRAEAAIRAAHPDLAERILLDAGGLSADAPERSWLLVDLLASRAALAQARASVDALPPTPFARVLAAHV